MNTTDPVHIACAHCGATNRVPAARLAEEPTCGRCGQALLPGEPVELTDANFDAVVGKTDLPVVVDFWAPWCGPCRMIGPTIEELAAENAGTFKVGKVNVDDNSRLAMTYNVASIPTIMIFSGGKLVQQFMGVQPKARLQQALDEAKSA